MQRHLVAVLLAVGMLLGLISSSPTAAQGGGGPDFAAIDAYVEAQRRAANVPGLAIGVVRDGEVVHTAGFGAAGPSDTPVTPQTPFVIGSIGKGMTALAVMQLVEQGRVDLDAPVQTYLPWFTLADPQAAARITVRMLLNQNSGLGYNDSMRTVYDRPGEVALEERLQQMSTLPLRREPGTEFEYSNFNYMILGAVVEAVSGQPYGEYVQQNIFDPLGMTNSTTSPDAAPGLAMPHRWWFGFPLPVDAPYLVDVIPAGYIISTADDMSRYLAFQQTGAPAILSPDGLETLHSSCIPATGENEYCMGWVRGPFGGLEALYHEGMAVGYYSVVVIEPNSGYGVVVLSDVNNMVIAPPKDIAVALLEHLVNGTSLTVSHRFWQTYGVIDLALVVLTGLMVWSLVRLPRWGRRLAETRPRGFFGWTGKVVLPVLSEFILPFIIWVFLPQGAGFPMWKVLGVFQPDLTAWVMLMAWLFVARGLLRVILALLGLTRSRA